MDWKTPCARLEETLLEVSSVTLQDAERTLQEGAMSS